MNVSNFSYKITDGKDGQVFNLIDTTGDCVGKILFHEGKGKYGKIYVVPLLGTSNGGEELDTVGLVGIEKIKEHIPGLLYIMFQCFLGYLKDLNNESFSVSIENPLLTLTVVYKNSFDFF